MEQLRGELQQTLEHVGAQPALEAEVDGETLIVAKLGNKIGEDPPRYGNFFIVHPVNEDAVTLLGTEPVQILEKDLVRISTNAILDAARSKKVR